MKPIVILHHSADFDGLFCREIARKQFGDAADYLGWDYGQPVPEVPPTSQLYMLDLAVPGLMHHPRLTWIDHHASAIRQYEGEPPLPGLRIDGVAACRLAWQWWFGDKHNPKQAYVDRAVPEPWAVELAGEYDVWDKRNPDAEIFQHGLRSEEIQWDNLLDMMVMDDTQNYVKDLLAAGRSIQYAQRQSDAALIQVNGHRFRWETLNWLAVNTARRNSLLFAAAVQPRDDALLAYHWNGQHWAVSLYGAPHTPESLDLSRIAIAHGGGGHRHACGFTTKNLPWTL